MKKLLLLFALPLLCLAQGSNKGGNIVFPGAPTGACTSPQIAVNAATGDQYNCLNSVWNLVTGGGGGGVSSLAATTPVTTSGSTGAITIGCATCTKSAASLTSTALVTGAGSQSEQTPSATSTLDASGNLSLAASVTTPSLTLNGTTAAAMATTATANAVVKANASGFVDDSFRTPMTYFSPSNGNGTAVTFAGSADVIRGTQFVLTQPVTFSNLYISVNTTDAANPVYGAAIVDVGAANGGFGTSGAARCHNTSGVQLAATLSTFPCAEGAVTLLPGNYVILTTSHVATGKYNGSLSYMTFFTSGGVTGCTASSGVWTFTTPCSISFSIAAGGVIPNFFLH